MKKRAATTSNTALELRRQAEDDRAQEQARRAERKELERRAALADLEAQRALEAARADAAAERRRELEASRLARSEEAASKEKAAREMQDKQWLQARYPFQLAGRLIEWQRFSSMNSSMWWRKRSCTEFSSCIPFWVTGGCPVHLFGHLCHQHQRRMCRWCQRHLCQRCRSHLCRRCRRRRRCWHHEL